MSESSTNPVYGPGVGDVWQTQVPERKGSLQKIKDTIQPLADKITRKKSTPIIVWAEKNIRELETKSHNLNSLLSEFKKINKGKSNKAEVSKNMRKIWASSGPMDSAKIIKFYVQNYKEIKELNSTISNTLKYSNATLTAEDKEALRKLESQILKVEKNLQKIAQVEGWPHGGEIKIADQALKNYDRRVNWVGLHGARSQRKVLVKHRDALVKLSKEKDVNQLTKRTAENLIVKYQMRINKLDKTFSKKARATLASQYD